MGFAAVEMTSNGRICFMHVGTGKTGSSAIQYALTDKRHDLLKAGFLYPDVGRNFRKVLAGSPTAGNGLTINALLHDENIPAAIDVVRRYSDATEHLVFSCEGFSNVRHGTLEAFAEQLTELGYTPKALAIFRPQTDKLVSSYLQQVKSNKKAIRLPLNRYANRLATARLGNWHARAKKLEAAFGRDNLTVRWYPALRRQGLDGIPAAAFEWLGVPLLYSRTDSSRSPLVNPTPTREALVILEEVNAKRLGGKDFADKFLQTALDRRIPGTKVALGQSALERVHGLTVDSNRQFLEEFCPDLDPAQELRIPERRCGERAPLDESALKALREIAAEILGRRGKNIFARNTDSGSPGASSSPAGSRPRCIIHVGMHKTGSTSIQASLSGYEDDHFLYADLGHSGNHSLPIYSLFASKPEQHHIHRARGRDQAAVQKYAETVRNNLDREIARAGKRTLIISGEDIIVLRPADLMKLSAYFRQRMSTIEVVAYVRPPAGLMSSRFQQLVKGGAIESFDFERIYQNYERLFEKLDNVFGRGHVQLWKFDPAAFEAGDVVRDFCMRLGIAMPPDQIVRVNESLSRAAVGVLYSYAKFAGDQPPGKLRGPEATQLGQIVGGEKFRFSPKLLQPILDEREADISWMERRLGASLREDMGSERPGDVCDENDLLQRDPLAIAQLMKALGRRVPRGSAGNAAEEIVQLVDAWRETTALRRKRWYARIDVARWVGRNRGDRRAGRGGHRKIDTIARISHLGWVWRSLGWPKAPAE